jgi:DNA-binding NarL/FixJ family response regulator
MKQAAVDDVIAAIRRVLRGERYLSRKMQERLLRCLSGEKNAEDGRPDLGVLSDRELEVFHFIGDGLGTREIATRLRLSIKTIETYRAHLREKLKLRNGLELIRLAMQMSTRMRRPGPLIEPMPSTNP